MDPHYLSARIHATVDSPRQAVIDSPRDFERNAQLYVVDADDKLVGTLFVQDLFRRAPESTVGDVMETRVIAVGVDDSAREAAKTLQTTIIPPCLAVFCRFHALSSRRHIGSVSRLVP